VLAAMVATLLFLEVFKPLGFAISTMIYFVALTYILEPTKDIKVFGVRIFQALVMVIIIYFVFGVALSVRLPTAFYRKDGSIKLRVKREMRLRHWRLNHGYTRRLSIVFQLNNFLLLVFGVILGIIVGAIPGLTATLAISLLLPFTFGLEATSALIMLIGIYCGGIYGGSITAILLRTRELQALLLQC